MRRLPDQHPQGLQPDRCGADDYAHFEGEPEGQTLLRNEITSFCANLDPSADEVLHAAFYGDKPPAAQAPVHIY
jgi:hypothetical protein